MLDYEEPSQADSMEGAVADSYVKIIEIKNLPSASPLTAELTAERPKRIVALSTFPTSILEEFKTEHFLKVLLPEENSLYTSEILQSIVVAVENDADTIYLPLTSESTPDIIFEAVEYAQSEGAKVFDAYVEN